MSLSSKVSARWLSALAVVSGCLGLLAACGGGTSQYDPFVPQRLLVFGDETSVITQNGLKYSVNGLGANGTVDCTLEPIWVQSLAALYGFVFPECNPQAVQRTQGRMLAVAGAKVSDVSAQVEAQVAAGGFRDKDLATMLAGANDIFELYERFPSQSEEALIAEAGARGRRLALVVNRLVELGVKVIVSDLPDLGLTPYALGQNSPGSSERSAMISRLTTAFNEQLGVNVLLDGRFVGLVQAQLRFQAIGRAAPLFGLGNITHAACTVELPNCTQATQRPEALLTSFLWADEKRLTVHGHNQLATLALDRAQRNPF